MRILDLFCGAGGAAMGLHRAFPEALIIGVDINPQPRYPFVFIKSDAMTYPLRGFDFIWASPMCQDHSKTRKILQGKGLVGKGGFSQIERIRERLIESGKPYVIENVPGAPLVHPLMLCGAMFDLGVLRHRYFETNFCWLVPPHPKHDGGTNSHRGYSTGAKYVTVGGNNYRRIEGERAMGIDWMGDRKTLNQAIPPAYSRYIGEQFKLSR